MYPRHLRGSFVYFALAVFLVGAWARAADEVPVYSPALSLEGRRVFPTLMDRPPRPDFPVSLIALGQLVENPSGRKHLEIEDVIYGDRREQSMDLGPISVAGILVLGDVPVGHRAIFFLTPTGPGGSPYRQSYTMDLEHLLAARSLARARFAELALNSSSIVIGEDTHEHPESWLQVAPETTRVKVIAQIAGEKLPENEVITVAYAPRQFAGLQLYFLLKRREGVPPLSAGYTWRATLPLDRKDEVTAALAKRESYPLVDDPSDPWAPRKREIVFEGTAQQALELLGSKLEAAHVLGAHFFFHHPEEAPALLGPLIEAASLQPGGQQPDEFAAQSLRIQTLGLAEHKAPTGAIAALVEKIIAALETGPAPVPIVPDRKGSSFAINGAFWEDPTFDVNHSLSWLIQHLPEELARQRWGERLLALKGRLTGGWQREVALVVDELRLEVIPELAAALERMKSVTPVRYKRAPQEAPIEVRDIYFSADHRRLWTLGDGANLYRWDAETMQRTGTQKPPEKTYLLSVAPGGQYVLFTDRRDVERPGPGKVTMIACDTGKTISSLEIAVGWAKNTHWLSDRLVLIIGYETVTLADFIHGKILRQTRGPQGIAYYISADRRFLLSGRDTHGGPYIDEKLDLATGASASAPDSALEYPSADRITLGDVTYERLDPFEQKPDKFPNLRGVAPSHIVQSADRRRMAITTRPRVIVDGHFGEADPKAPEVTRIYDAASLHMVAAIPRGGKPHLSVDGSQLAFVDGKGNIERWPLPQ